MPKATKKYTGPRLVAVNPVALPPEKTAFEILREIHLAIQADKRRDMLSRMGASVAAPAWSHFVVVKGGAA